MYLYNIYIYIYIFLYLYLYAANIICLGCISSHDLLPRPAPWRFLGSSSQCVKGNNKFQGVLAFMGVGGRKGRGREPKHVLNKALSRA